MNFKIRLIAFIFIFAGCSTSGDLIVSRLYFGLESGGSLIKDEEFITFVDSTITPVFPDGLTILRASGQWKNSRGDIIKEPSFIIEIIHCDDPVNNSYLNRIIEKYKSKYLQESVLLIQQKAGIQFK